MGEEQTSMQGGYEASVEQPQGNYQAEPQQQYEGTPQPAETTSNGETSTFAIRLDPRTGRKSIVSVGADVEEDNTPRVEQPRIDYNNQFSNTYRPQNVQIQQNTQNSVQNIQQNVQQNVPAQNVAQQSNLQNMQFAPQQPAKYQNAGEIIAALNAGNLDESRIPVEMAFQYAQFKQAQQQNIAQQTPAPANVEEQMQARKEFFVKVESMAKEEALKDLGLTEGDLAVAEYSDDAELQQKAAMYNTALAMHRNQIIQNVQNQRMQQIQAQQAQQAIINDVNRQIQELSQSEPHYNEIVNMMSTYFKQVGDFDKGVNYLIALTAYQNGNMTAQQAKDLREYYDKARQAFYAKANNIGTQPRRSPYVESPNGRNSNVNMNNDRAHLIKRLRESTDYREKRAIIGMLAGQ